MKRLIVIEGFDRCGKDSLLEDLEKNNIFVFKNDLEGLPKYDKEQDDFLEWLDNYIKWQIKTLNNLFKKHETIILTRFLVSDEVYSKLFNRKRTVVKYLEKLNGNVLIYNYCLLFESYDEYLKRLEMIGEPVQYSEEDFNKINDLYKEQINMRVGKIKYVHATDTKEDIRKDFINYCDSI